MHWGELSAAETAAVVVRSLGATATMLLHPESKDRTLEELNKRSRDCSSTAEQAAAWD
jgi:hypothetical protein